MTNVRMMLPATSLGGRRFEPSREADLHALVIAMAHGLELKVVAEGVETQAQMDFLKAQHCDELQGYLISEPVSAAVFAQLLQDQVVAY